MTTLIQIIKDQDLYKAQEISSDWIGDPMYTYTNPVLNIEVYSPKLGSITEELLWNIDFTDLSEAKYQLLGLLEYQDILTPELEETILAIAHMPELIIAVFDE